MICSCSALWDESQCSVSTRPHTIPQCYCPATEHHYAVKLISQIWRSPFQMPVFLQLCCCDHCQFGDFHILQTESRRLDLSAAFMGCPASQIDAAAAVLRPGPVWADYFLFFPFFYVLGENLCSARWDGAPRPYVMRLGCLFLHPSVRKSLLIKSPFSMLDESSGSWVMYQHFHNFITVTLTIPTFTVLLQLDPNTWFINFFFCLFVRLTSCWMCCCTFGF